MEIMTGLGRGVAATMALRVASLAAVAVAATETPPTQRVGSADFPIGWWSGDITCKNASRCEQKRPTSVLGSRGPTGLLTGAQNAVLNYWHVGYPDRHGVAPTNYTAADYEQYLDICHAHNTACMLGLPQALVHAGEADWIVRTMVAPLVNHSGLLGWYLYDEPWLKPPGPPPANPQSVTTKQLSAVAAAIRAVDGGRHLIVPCLARHWVGSPDFVAEQKGVYRLSDFADRVMCKCSPPFASRSCSREHAAAQMTTTPPVRTGPTATSALLACGTARPQSAFSLGGSTRSVDWPSQASGW